MVFKNPICSLPAVGGSGGRGGGSVRTITWHWRETRASRHLFLTQRHPCQAPLGASSPRTDLTACSPRCTRRRVPSNDSGPPARSPSNGGRPLNPDCPSPGLDTPLLEAQDPFPPGLSVQGWLTGPEGMSQHVSSSAWRESQ